MPKASHTDTQRAPRHKQNVTKHAPERANSLAGEPRNVTKSKVLKPILEDLVFLQDSQPCDAQSATYGHPNNQKRQATPYKTGPERANNSAAELQNVTKSEVLKPTVEDPAFFQHFNPEMPKSATKGSQETLKVKQNVTQIVEN